MANKVSVIHRRDEFKASKAMATRVLQHPNIEIIWNTHVLEFISNHDENNLINDDDDTSNSIKNKGKGKDELKLSYLLLEENQILENMNEKTGEIEQIIDKRQYQFQVDGVFVAIGHIPNTQLFDDDEALRRDSEGYVYTIPGSTVTSVTGVYAAGDGKKMGIINK